jgi:GntR family transcriptional regulator
LDDVDFRPLYAQVKDVLIRRIVAAEWRPGEALPSEGRLAAELGVSQGTVRKALDEMAAQNLLVRQQGRGTFVAKHDRERALFHFFHIVDAEGVKELPTSHVVALRSARPDRDQAQRLKLAPRARIHVILRVRRLKGRPAILERIAVPADLFPELALPIGVELPDELYSLYQQRYGVSIGRAHETLRAVGADALDAAHLQVPEGAPLLEIDRTAYSLDGTPAELRLSRCDTADHRYVTELE